MGKKIVVSFPGGRGAEIPLLYFGAKYYEDMGYEKVFINNPPLLDLDSDDLLAVLLNNAEKVVENLANVSQVLFISF